MHDQVKGPGPETAVAVPALQRFELGADRVLPPLAEPQAPLTMALQLVAEVLQTPCVHPAVAQPLYPEAVLARLPLKPWVWLAWEAEQFVFHVRVWRAQLLLEEQPAVVPVWAPVHDQVKGPEPETAVAVPALQRFVLGALGVLAPCADPQAPLTMALQVRPSPAKPELQAQV